MLYEVITKLIAVATTLAVGLILALVAVAWFGFERNLESVRTERDVTQPALQSMLLARFNVVQIQQFLVITSYSIHYTKLYDRPTSNRPAPK